MLTACPIPEKTNNQQATKQTNKKNLQNLQSFLLEYTPSVRKKSSVRNFTFAFFQLAGKRVIIIVSLKI